MMLGDSLKTVQWYVALGAFVVFFSFVLISSRKFKVTAKYSSWLSVLVLTIGLIVGLTNQKKQTQTAIQAERSIEPQNLTIKQVDNTSVVIKWTTDKKDLQFIRYKAPEDDWQIGYHIKPDGITTDHEVHLTGLTKNVIYEVVIRSSEATFSTYMGKPIRFVVK